MTPIPLLAKWLGLPKAGFNVKVTVSITQEGSRQRWERRFDGRPLISHLALNGMKATEYVGSLEIDYDLQLAGQTLTYHSRAARWKGRPIPKPNIAAILKETPKGWHVDVSVSLPIIGLVCHYWGDMEPV